MTLNELAQKLKALYPTRYSHFLTEQATPFICYLVVDSDTFVADDTVSEEITYVDIELYTATKNQTAEKRIKDMLKAHELPWSYDEIYIEDEGVFKCTFSIKLID